MGHSAAIVPLPAVWICWLWSRAMTLRWAFVLASCGSLLSCGDSRSAMHAQGAGGASPDGGRSQDAGARGDAAQAGRDAARRADGPRAGDGGTGCGTCPEGTTCGSANGLPVCRSATGIPRVGHVFVVLMENTTLQRLKDSTNTPYLHGLFAQGASANDYHGVAHPSLPNYIALVSGSTGGVQCDCNPTGGACNPLVCNTLLGACGCAQPGHHLGDQLDAARLSWRAYAEDLGTPCNGTSAGSYAVRHVPFLYFTTLTADLPRCADRVVDYGQLTGDLAGEERAFSFIAPNLVHDMHDPAPAGPQNLANGDAWLMTEIPKITGSAAYRQGGLLVIVWDEDDLSGVLAPDDTIPMIVLSPYAKSGGYASTTHADHYALLATLEDALGLPRLGAAAQARPLADYFPDR